MAQPLALTSGEPAGIGPDITLAAWLRRRELDLPPFYLLGDLASLAERAKTNPASRFGDPEEFGLACAFLCGAKAGYITGQNILLDGGAFPGTL